MSVQMMSEVYAGIFEKLQLPVVRVRADSGTIGGSMSHEFQSANSSGQDTITICSACERPWTGACCGGSARETRSIELAHTFQLGTRYSQVLGAVFDKRPLEMCCFGIGLGRLLAAW